MPVHLLSCRHRRPAPRAYFSSQGRSWFGSWDFGIAVTGLRGLLSLRLLQQGLEYLAAPFSEEDYRETVRATGERVVKDTDGIVKQTDRFGLVVNPSMSSS